MVWRECSLTLGSEPYSRKKGVKTEPDNEQAQKEGYKRKHSKEAARANRTMGIKKGFH